MAVCFRGILATFLSTNKTTFEILNKIFTKYRLPTILGEIFSTKISRIGRHVWSVELKNVSKSWEKWLHYFLNLSQIVHKAYRANLLLWREVKGAYSTWKIFIILANASLNVNIKNFNLLGTFKTTVSLLEISFFIHILLQHTK